MAQIIKKPSALGSNTVYFVGGDNWSDDRSEAHVFPNLTEANGMLVNEDGTNGAFKNATTETA